MTTQEGFLEEVTSLIKEGDGDSAPLGEDLSLLTCCPDPVTCGDDPEAQRACWPAEVPGRGCQRLSVGGTPFLRLL